MTATILSKQPPPRAAEMLDRQPAPGGGGAPYDQAAAGLYPGEKVVKLDSGDLVAIAVEPIWLENNAGLELYASARWVEADGTTKLSPHRAHVEIEFRPHFPTHDVERFGVPALAGEIVKLVLGEGDPAMVPVEDSPPLDPASLPPGVRLLDPANPPEGTVLDPAATERPLVPVSPTVLLNINIRRAIALVSQSGEDALDVADLLPEAKG
jgi:hypothetical protein